MIRDIDNPEAAVLATLDWAAPPAAEPPLWDAAGRPTDHHPAYRREWSQRFGCWLRVRQRGGGYRITDDLRDDWVPASAAAERQMAAVMASEQRERVARARKQWHAAMRRAEFARRYPATDPTWAWVHARALEQAAAARRDMAGGLEQARLWEDQS